MLPTLPAVGTADDDAVLDQAAEWLGQGRPVVLATVVKTWGSSPRPTGSHLAMEQDGAFVGSVSGGCIESAVIAAGLEAIADRRPRMLTFGVSDEEAWAVGLACGGAIQVYVQPVEDLAVFQAVQELRRSRQPAAVVTDLSSGAQAVIQPEAVLQGRLALSGDVAAQARAMLADEACGILPGAAGEVFVRPYAPPWSLVLVGAVHIAQALAPMAALAGFAVTVVDPRRGFAAPERFPGVRVTVGWPDDVLAADPPGRRTAVVTLSHDPKIDDPGLRAALRSPAFFVGALGSRRTHAARRQRLGDEGYTAADLDRIAAPVGLDIGSRLPGEIAVSILAEVVAVRHGRPRIRPSP